ncbi:MAG: ComEC/Rec2 family competence protein [Mycoplasma sp.]
MKNGINYKMLLIGLGIIVATVILCIFIPKEYKLSSITKNLLKSNFFLVRQNMMNHVGTLYPGDNGKILQMLIFNEKFYNEAFYDNFRKLGLLHLFVVSGLHISMLSFLIDKIFKKYKYIRILLKLILCSFLFYLTKFSLSILRALLSTILRLIISNKDINLIEQNAIVGLIFCFILPHDISGFSFILTMICTISISFIISLVNLKWLQFIVINITLGFITLPITAKFNDEINILGFLNGVAFNYVIVFFYIIEFFICWIPFISGFNNWVITIFNSFFNSLGQMFFIYKITLDDWIIISFYMILFTGCNLLWNRYFIINKSLINYNNLYV